MTAAVDWISSIPPRVLDRVAMMRARSDTSVMSRVRSLVHVGANTGQERQLYQKWGIDVTWIEPIREVYNALRDNIAGIPNQRAIQALVTDCDGEYHTLNISSNGGKSSSILELAEHRKLWPNVHYTDTMDMEGVTLSTLLDLQRVSLYPPSALVLDTQGSELMVLHGAQSILGQFQFVTVEVADFESYKGCCQVEDVAAFMTENGFREHSRLRFANRPGIGRYYDITYSQAGACHE